MPSLYKSLSASLYQTVAGLIAAMPSLQSPVVAVNSDASLYPVGLAHCVCVVPSLYKSLSASLYHTVAELIVPSLSLQSVLFETYSVGAEHACVEIAGLP